VFFFTGVGSRNTPPSILKKMTNISRWLTSNGWILRSGGAKGADTAFEQGVVHPSKKEIYLKGDATTEAMEMAARYHPCWDWLPDYTKQLHARNVLQVLGRDFKSQASILICWTPDGVECHADRTAKTGGTGTAISIASENGIRVFNIYNQNNLERLREFCRDWAGYHKEILTRGISLVECNDLQKEI
jgi:hypothetical protein